MALRGTGYWNRWIGGLGCALVLLLSCAGRCLWAQALPPGESATEAAVVAQPGGPEVGDPVGLVRVGSLRGTVMDETEAAVPGAVVTLQGRGMSPQRGESKGDGAFTFAGIAAGRYSITIHRVGFGAWSGTATVPPGALMEMGEIPLTLAAASTAFEVRASGREIAEAQVELEEKQRVWGMFPNFYASYVSDPEPLSGGQKFRLAWRFSQDPVTLAMVGLAAGTELAENSFSGYGHGSAGYARRYGAAYTDGLTSTMLGQALLPALLHQDPRYFVKGTGTVRSRVLYAVASAVRCKGDNRRSQMNYSNMLGNFASAGLSNTYYPTASRGVGMVMESALTATGLGAIGGLFQEFVLRRMTRAVPEYAAVR